MLTFILGFILGAAAVILRKLRLEAAILADARVERAAPPVVSLRCGAGRRASNHTGGGRGRR